MPHNIVGFKRPTCLISMAARRETKREYAREYAEADRPEKGRMFDALVATITGTRDHARRAIRAANSRRVVLPGPHVNHPDASLVPLTKVYSPVATVA